MDTLKQHIEQFQKRGKEYLQKRQEDALADIAGRLEALNEQIKTHEGSATMSSWDSEMKITSSTVVPEYFRYGAMKVVDLKGQIVGSFDIPLLLPTKVNAVMMNFGDDAVKVPNLFQSLIIRSLLSLRMDLVKVSIVDMNFGRSFPLVSSINNPAFKSTILDRQEEVSQLITGLSKEISEANRMFLGRYPDIDQYNANAKDMAHPYHFVFIDDFPDGFTSQAIDDLHRLIDNGNAAGTGIKIFINYSDKNPAPRDFNLQRFSKLCSCINKKADGTFSLENWPIKLPQNVVPSIDLDLPTKYRELIDSINGVEQKEVNYSLDYWIEDLKKNDLIWSGNTSDGIKVPIGFITPTKLFEFYMANDNDNTCRDFFALVAGQSGYGKTVLLHNVIVNAAMKYSPEELQIYLADFSNGTSFVNYRDLPHVKSLMLSNNKEYALRMMEHLLLESNKRAKLYKKAKLKYGESIETLASYRKITNEVLPRILFIIDEVQVLFSSTDVVTMNARDLLFRGIRDWRKYGISVILCSQSFMGVNLGNAETQITYRFAFKLVEEEDSRRLIRNGAANKLSRVGQAIMNNVLDGRTERNVEFQSAYSSHYLDYVKYLAELYVKKYGEKHVPYICEAEIDADIAENNELVSSIKNEKFDVNHQYCDVFVGKPDLLRDKHTRIRYQRRQNSNTLIVGHDYRTMIYDIMVQLIQLQGSSHPNSMMFVVDCFNIGNEYQGSLDGMQSVSEAFSIGTSQNIVDYIDKCCIELERRKEEQKNREMTEARWVLAIMNAQDCYELKPQPNKYGSTEPSETAKKLATLIAEGSTLGIHCIVHCQSYNTMFKTTAVLSSREFSMFENLILLKGADVSNMYFDNLKVAAPEEDGVMIVINGKIDNEAYEQCKAYSDITVVDCDNPTIAFMSNLFDKYRDA